MKTTKTDPMIREMKKARKASEIGKLGALAKELSFWLRRETIARNKLRDIRMRIGLTAQNLAQEVDERRLRDEVLP